MTISRGAGGRGWKRRWACMWARQMAARGRGWTVRIEARMAHSSQGGFRWPSAVRAPVAFVLSVRTTAVPHRGGTKLHTC